eukprot:m.908724 g.908724  ORF g.908724 m.908724 type:complete len:868 (+) comp23715_c1_seq4:345-2948(+)
MTSAGMYVRRYHFPAPSSTVVEQRIYAHRTRKNIMVTEFEIVDENTESANLSLATLFDPGCGSTPDAQDGEFRMVRSNDLNDTYLSATSYCDNPTSCSGHYGTNFTHEGYSANATSPGAVPLYLWWSENCHGHDSVTSTKAPATTNASYRKINLQGYVVHTPALEAWLHHPRRRLQPEPLPPTGMLALEMWYSGAQCDHASIATSATKAKYQSQGYQKLYTIGYIFTHPHGGNGPIPAPSPPPAPCHSNGSGCAGTFSENDILFGSPHSHTGNATTVVGKTSIVNDTGGYESVAITVSDVPGVVTLEKGGVFRVIASVTSSVGSFMNASDVMRQSQDLYDAAVYSADTLLEEHTTAWDALWQHRVVVSNVTLFSRAWDVATHANSAYYYLMSSQRADWSFGGMSPGGLSTQNYQGAVFMDMEMYMGAGLLFLQPNLTRSTIQYRHNSVDTVAGLAKLFGYKGLQFAWTSAALGEPFGCCSGHGGLEDCIEQHITPDVSFSIMQYYRATNDTAWLANIGLPIVQGVADWITSRVTAPDANGTFHITGIMPIDEWCDPVSGCQNPGVEDDPQMNAMSKIALEFAVEASAVVGTPAPAQWGHIADHLELRYDARTDAHDMPPRTISLPKHTSCPEDIGYLSFPMGPALGVQVNTTRNNLERWVESGLTCLENSGMTGPIHVVNYLRVGNTTAADQALNRSMLAAVYGPFNVRNEVDVHSTIVGGHFNNTHFLTGDGGYMNALLNGYMGMEFGQKHSDGLVFQQPHLPVGVDALSVQRIWFRGLELSVGLDASFFNISTEVRTDGAVPRQNDDVDLPTNTHATGSSPSDTITAAWVLLDNSGAVVANLSVPATAHLQRHTLHFPCRLVRAH